MKPHPSPRCVSSLSQQTSRAPLKVVTDQDGARAFSSKPEAGFKPAGVYFAALAARLRERGWQD